MARAERPKGAKREAARRRTAPHTTHCLPEALISIFFVNPLRLLIYYPLLSSFSIDASRSSRVAAKKT
jgi:hypothetical protein